MQKQIEGFRLSTQQARLWALQRGDASSYRAQCAVLVEGALDADALREAARRVVARHEILRTTFQRVPGAGLPFQVVGDEASFDWEQVARRDADAESVIEELFRQEGSREFDPERGPAARFLLAELSDETRVLFVTLPALCADFATLKALTRELGESFSAPAAAPSDEEPTQFVQFSEWQHELFEDGEADEAAGEFWRSRVELRRQSAPVIPFAGRAPRAAAGRPERVVRALPPETLARLRAAAARHDVTLEEWLLAAWQALLWRLSGEPVMVVESLSDGRRDEDLAGAFGPISQFLPVHCRFDAGLTMAECVRRVAQESRLARDWQEYFNAAGDEGADEAAARVAFEFLEWPDEQRAGAVSFSLRRQYTRLGAHRLKLACAERGGALDVELWAAPEDFAPAGLERLAGQFVMLLDDSARRPSAAVSQLQLVDEAERQRLVREWNDTRREYPADKCAHELFEAQAEMTPERVALVDGETRLTYRELNRRANKVAHYLRGRGVGAERLVGVCMERSAEMVVGLLGVLKAGGAYVPLDASYPAARLSWMAEDARLSLILTQRRVAEKLAAVSTALVRLDEDWAQIEGQPEENPDAAATPQNLAYVIYTSGSTGRPKGVMATHRGVVNYLSWCAPNYEVRGASGAPVHSSISFDLTVTSIFAPLLTGQSASLIPEAAGVEGLAAALRAGSDFSFVKLTPSHLKVLAQLLPKEGAARQTRALVVGGEALSSADLAYWREHAPETWVVNEYGPTEAVVGCCVYESTAGALPDAGPVPIGGPIANTQLYLLDDEWRLAPAGAVGELYIGGEGLARGYLNRPALTAERFVPDPFSSEPGARLYRTGDLARYVSDGCLEYLGRADEQVKVRGHRVELGEIEAALLSHEGVRECVVVARAEGEGGQMLAAYVVPRAGRAPAAGELRAFLGERLPDYMVPTAFVTLQSLPLTPNGKVDRRALPAPDAARPGRGVGYVAPRTALEEYVAHVWSEVLGVEHVGVNDNFFDLGGHSIKAMQVIARLLDSFQVELPPGLLFEANTVAELASLMQEHEPQPGLMEKIARALKRLEGVGEGDAPRADDAAAEDGLAKSNGAS
ncbi:MAG TPA: amino acid adenylation domain-containing protein [Pyrinomonadaceae bacterium]|jgi:amino acid adenylation domain-containing protein